MNPDQFATLPVASIVPSTTNPRQHFDDAKLVELSLSIQASGVHQPILVRPLPGYRVHSTDRCVTHEIVAGERRWRASQLGKVATIPVMVRELTDTEVLEIQIIENLQRADLTELEEAEGYERLMQASEITAEAVGAKIGKSRSYVYARLKLLDLCTEARKALREGQIDASRALLIARIPDGKLQIKALAEAQVKNYAGELGSFRTFQTWLQTNVMLRLERAPFQITDARLVVSAGSCKDCPKRTGANPDLFADVESADICTDPPCYDSKTKAHREQLVAKAAAKGMQVIEGKEAKAICSAYSTQLKGYSPLDQKRLDIDASAPSLRKLLGKDAPNPVLIENPFTKELIEAVPTEEAEALLVVKGALKATAKQRDVEEEIEDLREQAERRVRHETREAVWTATKSALFSSNDLGKLFGSAAFLREWLSHKLDVECNLESAVEWFNTTTDELPDETAILQRIQRASTVELQRAAAVYILEADSSENYYCNSHGWPLLEAAAPALALDLRPIATEVKKAVQADVSAKVKELKAQAKLAQPALLDPAPAAQAAKPAKPKRTAAPKATAAETMESIAKALQAQEPQALAIKARVRVNDTVGQLTLKKWVGKEGVVTGKVGPEAWDVTFKGRNGGLASFHHTELEVLA